MKLGVWIKNYDCIKFLFSLGKIILKKLKSEISVFLLNEQQVLQRELVKLFLFCLRSNLNAFFIIFKFLEILLYVGLSAISCVTGTTEHNSKSVCLIYQKGHGDRIE